MKVAFLSYEFGEYCIRLASAMASDAEVCLLLPQKLANPHLGILDKRVQLHLFQKPRLRQSFQQIRNVYQLLQVIKKFKPDVIHVQHGHFWLNLALPLLRRYPLVFTIHDPRHHVGDRDSHNTPQFISDFGYRRADQVIVHGNQLKIIVTSELHIPEKIVHVIPHLALGDDSANSEVQEEENLLLFFGRIWEYKGLAYLIQAEPLISARIPNIKIVIAGLGDDMEHYRRMMVNPEKFIIYNEYIPNERVPEMFRRASIVVLPYIEATQSGVIPMAYTFARPVVATTVGSLPEIVDDGHTGLLVPPRDAQALADAIVRLLQDKQLRQQMGVNGHYKINTECAPDTVARQTLEVYQRAIDEAQPYRRKNEVQCAS